MSDIYPALQNQTLLKKVSNTMDKVLNALDQAYEELKKERDYNQQTNFIHRIILNMDKASIAEEGLSFLLKGYMVNKHSSSKKKPTLKFLYLSQNLRFLCWKSLDKNDQKVIQLIDIENIAQGEDTIYFIKSPTIQRPEKCLVIMTKTKSLEIQCSSPEQMRKIGSQIMFALNLGRKMRNSYQI